MKKIVCLSTLLILFFSYVIFQKQNPKIYDIELKGEINSKFTLLKPQINGENILFKSQDFINDINNFILTFKVNGELFVDEKEVKKIGDNFEFTKRVNFVDPIFVEVKKAKKFKKYKIIFQSYQATKLPAININTLNEQNITSKIEYLSANISFYDENFTLENSNFKDKIRGRGNYSWRLEKKPYRIKFNEKTSLFGLEKNKNWILLANIYDKSLLITCLAFELGKKFDFDFTNSCFNVELFLNEKYNGSYVLTEQKEVGQGRIQIDNDGFLLEMDSYFKSEPKFKTKNYNLPIQIKYPKFSEEEIIDNIFTNSSLVYKNKKIKIYQNGKKLIYEYENCKNLLPKREFFVNFYPANKDDFKDEFLKNKFKWKEFVLANNDNSCSISFDMPNWEVKALQTGQFKRDKNIWQSKKIEVLANKSNFSNEKFLNIKKQMDDFEELIFSEDFPNNSYKDIVDINSLIDYIIVNEMLKNDELGHPKSVFLYKKDSKIKFGPIWDFD